MRRASIALAILIWGAVACTGAFAQPFLNRVENFVRDQIDNVRSIAQPVEPGYLGLTVDDRLSTPNVVRIKGIVPGGPAAQAGLQAGDILLSIDGILIASTGDVDAALDGEPVGAQLSVGVRRGSVDQEFEVMLGRRPAATDANDIEKLLGVRATNVTDDSRRTNNLPDQNGALIMEVIAGSPAARAGIPNGAVIVAFNGRSVNNPQDLAAAVRASAGREAEVMFISGAQATRAMVAVAALMQPAPVVEIPVQPAQAIVKPRPSDYVEPVPATHGNSRTRALEARIRELEARLARLENQRAAGGK